MTLSTLNLGNNGTIVYLGHARFLVSTVVTVRDSGGYVRIVLYMPIIPLLTLLQGARGPPNLYPAPFGGYRVSYLEDTRHE